MKSDFIISKCRDCGCEVKNNRQPCGKLVPRKLCDECHKELRRNICKKMTLIELEKQKTDKKYRQWKLNHMKKLCQSNKGKNNWMYGRRGDQTPMWNPNLTDKDREDRRHMLEWINFRNECLEDVEYTCELTGEVGGLEVHHLESWAKFPEKRYDKTNIKAIKKDLHREFHKIYGTHNFTKADFFEFANLVESR